MKMRPRIGGEVRVEWQGENDPWGPAVVIAVGIDRPTVPVVSVLLDSKEAYTFAMSVMKARRQVQIAERERTPPSPHSEDRSPPASAASRAP